MAQASNGKFAYVGKRDAIVKTLREEIVRGDLRQGDRLRQEDLAVRFGVSPTPVREALRVLETQGFVAYEAHRGVTVANFAGSFDQVYRLREALEVLATELAVANVTRPWAEELKETVVAMEDADRRGDFALRQTAHARFHELLYGACRFPALLDLIEIVWSRFPWYDLMSLPGLSSRVDHRAIAERAAEGDAVAAAEELRSHLRAVRDVVADALQDRASRRAR